MYIQATHSYPVSGDVDFVCVQTRGNRQCFCCRRICVSCIQIRQCVLYWGDDIIGISRDGVSATVCLPAFSPSLAGLKGIHVNIPTCSHAELLRTYL